MGTERETCPLGRPAGAASVACASIQECPPTEADRPDSHLGFGREDTRQEALQQLASAGAGLALLASISVHIAFDDVRAATPLPLVDIVEATADAVTDFKRLGLCATRFTMQADLFGTALTSRGISMVAPTADEQETIDRVYFDELVAGRFLPASRDRLLAIGTRLRDDEDVDGILLGGTELPLLLPMANHDEVVYLDSTRIHADPAVAAMLA